MIATSTEKPAILIVEDHELVRDLLRLWIARIFPSYVCLGAESGEKAVELARIKPFKLVVMDIGLPGINGIKATRSIKLDQPTAQVVILSIFEENQFREDAAQAGAAGYISKARMQTDLIPLLSTLL